MFIGRSCLSEAWYAGMMAIKDHASTLILHHGWMRNQMPRRSSRCRSGSAGEEMQVKPVATGIRACRILGRCELNITIGHFTGADSS